MPTRVPNCAAEVHVFGHEEGGHVHPDGPGWARVRTREVAYPEGDVAYALREFACTEGDLACGHANSRAPKGTSRAPKGTSRAPKGTSRAGTRIRVRRRGPRVRRRGPRVRTRDFACGHATSRADTRLRVRTRELACGHATSRADARPVRPRSAYVTSTAAPFTSPRDSRPSATFASASGWRSYSGFSGIFPASSSSSRAS